MVKKVWRVINNTYAFGVYTPNKYCKQVTYNDTEYLSKAQCMALEGITRKELDEYLNGGLDKINKANNEVVNVKEVNQKRDLLKNNGGNVNLDDIF